MEGREEGRENKYIRKRKSRSLMLLRITELGGGVWGVWGGVHTCCVSEGGHNMSGSPKGGKSESQTAIWGRESQREGRAQAKAQRQGVLSLIEEV